MSDFSVTQFESRRRDSSGPVTCAVCGCRLLAASGGEDGAYRHFPSMHAGQDARGCRPQCVDALHDFEGRVLIVAESGRGSVTNDAAAA
jgi:hypothetical protein